MKKTYLFSSLIFLFFIGCGPSETPKIEFTFTMNEITNTVPSYQMAIWMETPDGNYVETFFVCDYLSYGGYNIEGICPVWVKKAHWEKTPEEVVDAVTQATPDIGGVQLVFNAPVKKFPAGTYKYFIEIHNAENYNEIYSGTLAVKKDGSTSVSEAAVTYNPKKYPEGSGLLSNVKAKYFIGKE